MRTSEDPSLVNNVDELGLVYSGLTLLLRYQFFVLNEQSKIITT